MLKSILFRLFLILVFLISVSSAKAAAVNNIQTGSVTLVGSSTTVSLCDSIEVDKSILLFTITNSTNSIGSNLITGEIAGEETITFRRSGTTSNVEIKWQVIEYSSGVTVQRGSSTVNSTTFNQAITAVADLSKSFPIISMQNNGGSYGTDDGINAEITSTTNLQFRCTADDFEVYWQVVEYDSCDVQTFTINLADGATSATGAIASVNTSKTLILGSHIQDGTVNADDLARIELTNSTTVTATRVGSSRNMTHFGYAIEFTDETTVQQGLFDFTIGGASRTKTLGSAIQVDRSVIFGLGNFGVQGSSTYSTNDNVGYNWVNMEIVSTTEVTANRAATGASANVSFQVLSFRYDQTNPPGTISDLVDPTGPFDNMYLNRKETGSVTLAGGDNLVTASISSVNMDSTFMLFSIRTSSNAIGGVSVAGEITNPTTLSFARSDANANDIEIEYQVFYFATGVYVQHGTTTVGSNTNQAINAVDLEKSFVLASFKNAGSTLGSDDGIVADLTTSTNIQFRSDDGLGDDVVWQVVEMQDALVRKVEFILADGNTSTTANISDFTVGCGGLTTTNGVDLDHTFMVSNHTNGSDLLSDDLARVQLTDTNEITANRVGSSGDLGFVAYVVELFDSSMVQRGNISITGTNTAGTTAITTVNEISSGVFPPSNMGRQGSTTFNTDDDMGYPFATYTLNSATEVGAIRSGTSSATTTMPYQILSFDNFRENPLPIALKKFDVSLRPHGKVYAEWITSSELNNDFFTLERRLGNEAWEVIGTIEGAGNSSRELQYRFIDQLESIGVYYYRLKQTDFDGKSKHFFPKSVRLSDGKDSETIYPNPTQGKIYIKSLQSATTVQLFNLQGTLLRVPIQSSQEQGLELDLSGLPNGMYLIKTNEGVQKVIKN